MFSPCLTYLVWQTRYILLKLPENLRSLLNHPGWLLSCIQPERSVCEVGKLVWGPLYKNSFILFVSVWKAESTGLCKYLTCWSWHSLPKVLLCFSLLDALCTNDMWNHLPWNHVTGSRDKSVFHFVGFLLRTLVPPALFLLCDVNPVTCSTVTPAHFVSLQCWWPFWPHTALLTAAMKRNT